MLAFERGIFSRPHGAYAISTDRARLDFPAIHRFLSEEAPWSLNIEAGLLHRAIAGSLPFAAYDASGALAGFCRVVTDGACFAYLRDVFVLPHHRGQGLGRALARAALEHPDLATVRNWMLATADAHGVYAALGFAPLAAPGNYMQRRRAAEPQAPHHKDTAA
ncbi:GNAT family N-acetyltransferase [Acetobacteraceae bacterium H6797]|nr:GNAT family N-acetyltransferase [Acetobacteraceae bacterium H6797]